MLKSRILQRAIETLEAEATAVDAAARAAHEAATHEESRAEDAHDTRGLEASYLAGAQAARVADLNAQITALRQLVLPERREDPAIEVGALVQLKATAGARKPSLYLLVERGGGLTVELDGARINLLSPTAPLGEELLGKRTGDLVEVEVQGMTREYEIGEVS